MNDKKRLIYMIFGLILGITGIVLSLIWFSWKLPLVLFILTWSNNISIKYN